MSDYCIPEPCHEDWEAMRPEERGRHCAVCDKVVVDLTILEPDRAKVLLDDARAERGAGPGESIGVCVRSHARPLTARPGHVLTGGMAMLLAFGGAGCSEATGPDRSVGEAVVTTRLGGGETCRPQALLGKVAAPPPQVGLGGILVEPAPPPVLGEVVEEVPRPAPPPEPVPTTGDVAWRGEVVAVPGLVAVVPEPDPVLAPVSSHRELEVHRGWTLVGEWRNGSGAGPPGAVVLRHPQLALADGRRFATLAEARAFVDGVMAVERR